LSAKGADWMKTTNYSIRIDPEIKTKAEETFAEFGLNLSEAITVFCISTN
jgi:addiction module RelB/DinJ family antitoxin